MLLQAQKKFGAEEYYGNNDGKIEEYFFNSSFGAENVSRAAEYLR